MENLDWIVVSLYFILLGSIAWYSSKNQKNTKDYFLAGRHTAWFVVGASLFASNIGSEHIVGLAGNGATSGMAMAHYELHAWIMVLLAWVFVPFYYRSGVFTMQNFWKNALILVSLDIIDCKFDSIYFYQSFCNSLCWCFSFYDTASRLLGHRIMLFGSAQ